jgi:hypothetical protein
VEDLHSERVLKFIHEHDNTIKSIAAAKTRGPERQAPLVQDHWSARLAARATRRAGVWQGRLPSITNR